MADKISLSIVTADGVAFEKNVSYINLPTACGSVGILGDHAPMLCAIAAGSIRCKDETGKEYRVQVGEGIANVRSNIITCLVSKAETEE